MAPATLTPPRTLKELGAYLREHRLAAGLTQKQVIKATEVDGRNLSRWENGKNEPGAVAFLNVVDALGVTFSQRPPASIPKAVNEELRLLREEVGRVSSEVSLQTQLLQRVVELLDET